MCNIRFKICSHCKLDKPIESFVRDSRYLYGRGYICLPCSREQKAATRKKDPIKEKEAKEKARAKAKAKRLENPEKYRERDKERYPDRREYYKKNPRKRRSYKGKSPKRQGSTQQVSHNLASRVRFALKRGKKAAHTTELIGCTIACLKIYLESLWQPEMSWDNYGKNGWHIDHIRPCTSFDLTDPEQQKECFHWSNLQPLWAKDNISKGNKVKLSDGTILRGKQYLNRPMLISWDCNEKKFCTPPPNWQG